MATAKDVLDRAAVLVKNGETEKAKQFYQVIIDRMPDSEEAKTAQACLDKLNAPPEMNFDDLFEGASVNTSKDMADEVPSNDDTTSDDHSDATGMDGQSQDASFENIHTNADAQFDFNPYQQDEHEDQDKKLNAKKPIKKKDAAKKKGKGKKNKGCLIAIAIFIIVIIIGIASCSGSNDSSSSSSGTSFGKKEQVAMADFSNMAEEDRNKWGSDNDITIHVDQDYSDTVQNGGFISQSVKAGKKVDKGSSVTLTYSKGPKPTQEQENALISAKEYSDSMHMSKQGIYDQLTSSYGEGFSANAAQYAVDHLNADYNKNALESAKTYQSEMHMSKSAIYDQLTSSYGEKFTASEAQYAVDHLSD